MDKIKINILSILCSLLQIFVFGFVIIVLNRGKQLPLYLSVLLGIAGFAGVVKFLIPDEKTDFEKMLQPFAVAAGIFLIVAACGL